MGAIALLVIASSWPQRTRSGRPPAGRLVALTLGSHGDAEAQRKPGTADRFGDVVGFDLANVIALLIRNMSP
jgi:hypothetical protein